MREEQSLDPGLAAFNAAPDPQVGPALSACLAVPRWVQVMTAGRPYADRSTLLARAGQQAASLTDREIDEALARHPRIGERPAVQGREASWSRSEQSAVDPQDDGLAADLRAGNLAYEDRFGHVFLIRAAGRSGAEMLDALRERLKNDPATERDVVRHQLGEIARLRLAKVLDDGMSS